MIYFYSPIVFKTALTYFVHWTIYFDHYDETSYFISFKLLKLTCYNMYVYVCYFL